MLLLAWNPLNLSKASQFGSTLVGGRLRGSVCWKFAVRLGSRRVVLSLGRPFLDFMVARCRFFLPENAQIVDTGQV